MLHAKYHWLKQFEMNDKHQVQLYSFGMSTGLTTLLGLFYIIDQGSADRWKWHCNYHEKCFTCPLNPGLANYHARESGTCVLRKHNFDEFMFSIFQGSLSLHPVVKPTKWVTWIQSDRVKRKYWWNSQSSSNWILLDIGLGGNYDFITSFGQFVFRLDHPIKLEGKYDLRHTIWSILYYHHIMHIICILFIYYMYMRHIYLYMIYVNMCANNMPNN